MARCCSSAGSGPRGRMLRHTGMITNLRMSIYTIMRTSTIITITNLPILNTRILIMITNMGTIMATGTHTVTCLREISRWAA